MENYYRRLFKYQRHTQAHTYIQFLTLFDFTALQFFLAGRLWNWVLFFHFTLWRRSVVSNLYVGLFINIVPSLCLSVWENLIFRQRITPRSVLQILLALVKYILRYYKVIKIIIISLMGKSKLLSVRVVCSVLEGNIYLHGTLEKFIHISLVVTRTVEKK